MSDYTFDEYQRASAATLNYGPSYEMRLANYALGLAGEAGEVVEQIKKHVFHGKNLDVTKIQEEIGDVLWYLNALATEMGIRVSDSAAGNEKKLRARYPEGFIEGGGNR